MDNNSPHTHAAPTKAALAEFAFQVSLLNLMTLDAAPMPARAFEQMMFANAPLAA